MNKTILIVAGGTGGHLYPGIALARALAARGWKPSFVVRRGDLGRSVLQREGFPVRELSGQGLPRQLSRKWVTFPFRLAAGAKEAFQMIKAAPPACAVGMGGYLSFPVLAAARCRRVPTLIHEQNVIPGLANRLLSKMVNKVAVSFEESQARFPVGKSVVTGLPVRSDMASYQRAEARRFLELDTEALTFLVFGGSQGAQHLNEIVAETWKQMSMSSTRTFQIIHITGERDFARMEKLYNSIPLKTRLMPYCHTMPAAYAAADLVICRSGASTVAELIAAQRLSVLVPFPFASADHQRFNAAILAAEGVAQVLSEKDLTPKRLEDLLNKMIPLLSDSKDLASRFATLAGKVHTNDAALRLAQQVESLVGA